MVQFKIYSAACNKYLVFYVEVPTQYKGPTQYKYDNMMIVYITKMMVQYNCNWYWAESFVESKRHDETNGVEREGSICDRGRG